MDVRRLATAEVNAINRTFTEFGIVARVAPQQGTLIANSSHIAHRLQRGDGVRISEVEKRLPEIRQALARVRSQDELPVRLQWPLIETPHPSPVPLRLPTLQAQPHEMLIGRAYTSRHEVKDERITFDDSPHVLIAGITNAGKSVLAQTMLLSLVANTSPADLQLVIVDLKNEDMTPFANLPHVARFARRPAEALDAIRMVQSEKEKRIDKPSRKPFRLVLWIDEVAQLANDREAIEMLGDIASIGRSKAINLVVATQHPTASGGIGGLMKANFPLRLVGMVAPGTAHIATNRPGTGAEQLPGKGSFLYLQSNDVHRFQSFYVSADDVHRHAQQVKGRWTGTQAVTIKQPDLEAVYHSTMPAYVPPAEPYPPLLRMAAKAMSTFDRFYNPATRQLERGGVAAVIRSIYGPKVNTGGVYRDNALQVIEYLSNATNATTTIATTANMPGNAAFEYA